MVNQKLHCIAFPPFVLEPNLKTVADSRGRKMFDTALLYFADERYYKGERARALFKKAQFLGLMDDKVGASEAMREAERLYYEIRPERITRHSKKLQLEHFDEIVMIMSR